MPYFKFTGKSKQGVKKNGRIYARSRKQAIEKLRDQGIAMAQVDEIANTFLTQDITIGNPVKLEHFVMFLRQFATLLKAGVTIVDSTNILSRQTSSKALARALEDVEEELTSGVSFSNAAEKHTKIFPPIFINMVRAGEVSGSLDDSLDRLAIQFEKQHETKQKVKSALAYPMVISVVAVAVVTFLLIAVVPMFASMLTELGGEIPAITRLVLGASHLVTEFWWLIVLVVFLIVGAIAFLKKNDKTSYYFDYCLLKIPVFGSLLQKASLARMTRTLSSLFSSSVPILQSLKITERVIENEVISKTLLQSRKALEEGMKLTDPMHDSWIFPPLVVQMISIGEATGSLDTMLGKVADFYEKEVEYTTDRLRALIEPLLIVFLAVIVGIIVISIIVPMFQIYNEI